MRNQNVANLQRKPSYALESVDNALRLIQLLRDVGQLRIKDAAEELGIAPSTAHRLMAMLVYRDFAVQNESRHYQPGPAIGLAPAGMQWAKNLRIKAQPHLELLSSRLSETVNLMIRVGSKVRFLSTIESDTFLRVGDRQGTVFNARATSGGKALLAELPESALHQLYRSKGAALSGDLLDERAYASLTSELATARTTGYALNRDSTELGVSAVGFALHNIAGEAIGAFAVASPSLRFTRLLQKQSLELISICQQEIDQELKIVAE